MNKRTLSLALLATLVLAGCGASEGSPDASSGTPDSAGAGVSCNPEEVSCESLPPDCGDGELPSVSGTCWGPCVPFASCVCDLSDRAQCPDPYVCGGERCTQPTG